MARFESGLTGAAAEIARRAARRLLRAVRRARPGRAGAGCRISPCGTSRWPSCCRTTTRSPGGRPSRWTRWPGETVYAGAGNPRTLEWTDLARAAVRRAGHRARAARARGGRRGGVPAGDGQDRNPVLAVVDFSGHARHGAAPARRPVPLSPLSLVWRTGPATPVWTRCARRPPNWPRQEGWLERPSDAWLPEADVSLMCHRSRTNVTRGPDVPPACATFWVRVHGVGGVRTGWGPGPTAVIQSFARTRFIASGGCAYSVENWREDARIGHTHEPNEVTVQLDGLGRQLAELPAGTRLPPDGSDGPVFVDESGRRSKKFRRLGWVLAIACAVLRRDARRRPRSAATPARPGCPVSGQEAEADRQGRDTARPHRRRIRGGHRPAAVPGAPRPTDSTGAGTAAAVRRPRRAASPAGPRPRPGPGASGSAAPQALPAATQPAPGAASASATAGRRRKPPGAEPDTGGPPVARPRPTRDRRRSHRCHPCKKARS